MKKSPYYDEIKTRAIELLQTGCINNHSIDELKSCGRFVCKNSISAALLRAMDEVQQRTIRVGLVTGIEGRAQKNALL
jgi:hypothetical protein